MKFTILSMNREMPGLIFNNLRILWFMVPKHARSERGLPMNIHLTAQAGVHWFTDRFGFGIKPVGQESKLVGGNVATMDPVNQMRQKLRWKIVTADAQHGYSP